MRAVIVSPCECPRCKRVQSDDMGLCVAPDYDPEIESLLETFFGRFVDAEGRVRDTVSTAPGWVVDCAEALRSARAERLRNEDEKRKMREEFKNLFK